MDQLVVSASGVLGFGAICRIAPGIDRHHVGGRREATRNGFLLGGGAVLDIVE